MIAATLRQMAAPVATVKSEIHITSLRRCVSQPFHLRKSLAEADRQRPTRRLVPEKDTTLATVI
jgi:hypothetical protein